MENSVQLGTQYYRESLCDRLLKLRDEENLPILFVETRQGGHSFFNCHFNLEDSGPEESQTLTKIHRYYLANALAEIILNHWEPDYVKRMIRHKYRLKDRESEDVVAKAMERLNTVQGQGYRVHRKTHLVEQILASLDSASAFDVEGFLRFRANQYKEELDKAVSYAVDDYVLQKEYLEFIRLLKYFLDTQIPRLETMHVVINSFGSFHLYNDQGVKVTQEFLEDSPLDGQNSDFSYEDLLISALIAAAPKQVVLHICFEGYRDTLQTIKEVFEDRVSYCTGCSFCEEL
ncbi:putative sporulation protein YtxC [Paradesulfitobacterium ferrireducens]|uniref:putative sporulation protein YtxC n=1 Tax=Paradesulfitobacterium ferrireducens TaxID=2816476 RepID=UPI001A8CFDEE|nr:putative sporulation protein YtxC [Paradesulfitobacterium ferrireducens]